MIRKGLVLVLAVSSLTLLALILHIRLTQNPNDDTPVKLPTDGVWISQAGTRVLVAFMLDDVLRLECYDPNAMRKWDQDFRFEQAYLARLVVGEERLVVFDGLFAGGIRPGRIGVMFPLWAPCLVLAVYPTIAFIRGPYRRYRRRKKGLCLKCGYNLTGNISGICPECGEHFRNASV